MNYELGVGNEQMFDFVGYAITNFTCHLCTSTNQFGLLPFILLGLSTYVVLHSILPFHKTNFDELHTLAPGCKNNSKYIH